MRAKRTRARTVVKLTSGIMSASLRDPTRSYHSRASPRNLKPSAGPRQVADYRDSRATGSSGANAFLGDRSLRWRGLTAASRVWDDLLDDLELLPFQPSAFDDP